ncbi:MAG: GDP-mannose 4,6-dehydratase [Lentisphaeria bacterium]|jgi:UDP-glucose 4-epimerase|nr:GDP-mannose 4,6-dehydratase [Lentisphaeria bacterium]
MRALITGGAGFVGSWLARELLARGTDVLVLDDLSTGRYENLEEIEDGRRLELVVDTVNDPAIVNECVKRVDQVFHLASAVGVRLIIEQPVRTIESIVGGTDVVLRACARYRRPVLITSTSEVYGKGSKIPFSEEDDRIMGATTKRRWSYACAKALDEFLALAHWYESRLPVVIARMFNTVGPRQTGQYGMVVPTFVRQALRNQPVTVYGDGQQSRCFGHVQDVVAGLADLLACPQARGEIVNLGNNQEVTIRELAERVCQLAGSNSEVVLIPYDQAYGEGFDDMRRRVPDLSKAARLIGYQPRRQLDTILGDVIDFERGQLDGSKRKQ